MLTKQVTLSVLLALFVMVCAIAGTPPTTASRCQFHLKQVERGVSDRELMRTCGCVRVCVATGTCPPDCSGHGTRLASGACQCAAGFTGNECQFESKPHTPGKCVSTGDPHITTFSGAYYSYQGTRNTACQCHVTEWEGFSLLPSLPPGEWRWLEGWGADAWGRRAADCAQVT